MLKILKENTENFKKLEELNSYLIDNNITLTKTVYNGIIYGINNKYYKYKQEEDYPETLPPLIEGKYVECDEMGHTDYYN
jgi:hypothetical protein